MISRPCLDMVVEARREVRAAQHNMKEAISSWEKIVVSLNPAVMLLTAAERRLEHANALLRSAIERQ